jgi:DNA-binding NarL/FixJ family response regulator
LLSSIRPCRWSTRRPQVDCKSAARPIPIRDRSGPRFEATTRILDEAPGTAIAVLRGSNDPDDVERARTAGAAGYVTKDRILAELVAVIRSAARPG